MKAIVVREYGEPEVMRLEEVEIPEPVGKQVLVKLNAIGVNPVDTYLRTGLYAYVPQLPYTPGKDAAGVIEKCGPEVTKFEPGERVYTAGSISGTYAEYTLCDESQIGRLPDNISFEEGACIWTPYATSYRALFQKARCIEGETVLIHGASGGVGSAAIQWAKWFGLRVFATAGSQEGLEHVLKLGADKAFNHSDEDHFSDIREASEQGVDVIIEMLANVNLERDFEAIARFGRIVIVGSRGSLMFTPRQLMTKDITVFGMSLFNALANDLAEIHREIYEGLADGRLKPVVGKKFSLAEAPAAHHAIIEQKALGKIILIP
ncbi:MAG TPA: NADPH:quinone reductase [Pyrinomonadaceae bacterium]|nr:NADPH:quinone reductase [Pyrinomonadaceae bacterium]